MFERLRSDCTGLSPAEFDVVVKTLVSTVNDFVDVCDEQGYQARYFYESAAASIAKDLGITDEEKLGDIEFLAFEFRLSLDRI